MFQELEDLEEVLVHAAAESQPGNVDDLTPPLIYVFVLTSDVSWVIFLTLERALY